MNNLAAFFSYFGMSMSQNPDDFELLKKKMMIAFKQTDFIQIEGKGYSKQDLINLFDSIDSKEVSRIIGFSQKYGVLVENLISHPEMFFQMNIDEIEKLEKDDLIYFQNEVEHFYYNTLKFKLNAALIKRSYKNALAYLKILLLLSKEHFHAEHDKLSAKILIGLKSNFDSNCPDNTLINEHYYVFLKCFSRENDSILVEQIDIHRSTFPLLPIEKRLKCIELQIEYLTWRPDILVKLKTIRDDLYVKCQHNSNRTSSNWVNIAVVSFVIIFILRYFIRNEDKNIPEIIISENSEIANYKTDNSMVNTQPEVMVSAKKVIQPKPIYSFPGARVISWDSTVFIKVRTLSDLRKEPRYTKSKFVDSASLFNQYINEGNKFVYDSISKIYYFIPVKDSVIKDWRGSLILVFPKD